MLGQQAKADKQMGFAAAHRLFQMKDRLRGNPGEASNALSDEVLHTEGDVGPFEKDFAVARGVDQFVELLDLVTEFDGQRVGLERASVANGFHADLLE